MKVFNKISLCLGLLAAGISLAQANEAGHSGASMLRGGLEAQQGGDWHSSSAVPQGQWVRSTKADTTVRLPGMILRLQSGAEFKLDKPEAGLAHLNARGGRVYVKLDSNQACAVKTEHKVLHANHAEFVLDAGPAERVYILDGEAQWVETSPSGIAPKPLQQERLGNYGRYLSLDGPDVRKRNRKRNRFTQGEQNTGKKVTEQPTYSPTPPPETPAYTPPPASPPPASPPASPPPQQPPPVVDGGFDPWPLVGGLAGVGGVVGFLVNRDKGSSTPPASR